MSNSANEFLNAFINQGRYMECAREAHEAWREIKTSQGRSYGEKRDPDNKKNPFLLPFEELPEAVQGANSATPYAVANFFRTVAGRENLEDLEKLFEDILAGKEPELLEELGEYIHSHFIISLLSKGESTKTRRDMVVYEDLDDDTRSWDTYIGQEVIRFMQKEIKTYEA